MTKQSKTLFWLIGLASLSCFLLSGIWVYATVQAKYRKIASVKAKLTEAVKKIDNTLHYDEPTHWQRERWEIETFFHTPEAIEACGYISGKETSALHDWVKAGGDVNLTGDYGITLLFWAMLDRNMRAYQALLSHGARADHVLTSSIELRNGRVLFEGDSVMFASLAFIDDDFVLVAMPYSDNPDHRDRDGQNLIVRLAGGLDVFNFRPSVFSELVRAGVDPDVRMKRDGSVPIIFLLSYGSLEQCYAMLLAGADPTFESAEGDSVVNYVQRDIEFQKKIPRTSDYVRLVRWLVESCFLEGKYLKILEASVKSQALGTQGNRGTGKQRDRALLGLRGSTFFELGWSSPVFVAPGGDSTASKLTKRVNLTLMPGRARSDLYRLVSSGSRSKGSRRRVSRPP